MVKNNKNIVVLGAGESGVGAALLSQHKGYGVFVSDFGKIKENFKAELIENNINYEEEQHTESTILNADLIVKSPGIADTVSIVKKALSLKIPVISEIEFAGRFTKAKTICITGSNGKTTTAFLTHHILSNANVNVGLAGNIGKSFARQVIKDEKDVYVLELSSFQLDGMYDFKADIAILLNITPDHLDRYEYDMQKYVDSKFRICQHLTKADWFIYNADDPIIMAEVAKRNIVANKAPFSIKTTENVAGYINNNNQLIINLKPELIMSIHDLALKGKHNAQNSLAAGIASKVLEIRNETVRESLQDFKNVEHRLEFVGKVNGIEFINDSKATNVNSTWYALESMENPVVWIVGGIDKGNDYDSLIPLVKEKVKAIICLGEENDKILEAFTGVVDTIVEAKSAYQAVTYGYELAKADQTVLLSPACASFDLFESYEDRGRQFKKAVRSL
ncbi:UDP-N-acetylmuramoyl-L-alanine--D-glutamate ligase [Putridiphycobacter roseus]|uniref:UDP-N-acetylmuramoylalanine--D-glutamate ligase n=1 Tax=Putridiphycobacter roseus TaxID=2219161 RepID=A0A2W1NUW8_9FLAO|nr:UDP-N-acetylmuramoyl-L-alanine--D-glutamate ligase [Putridiphycobacter roseus]